MCRDTHEVDREIRIRLRFLDMAPAPAQTVAVASTFHPPFPGS